MLAQAEIHVQLTPGLVGQLPPLRAIPMHPFDDIDDSVWDESSNTLPQDQEPEKDLTKTTIANAEQNPRVAVSAKEQEKLNKAIQRTERKAALTGNTSKLFEVDYDIEHGLLNGTPEQLQDLREAAMAQDLAMDAIRKQEQEAKRSRDDEVSVETMYRQKIGSDSCVAVMLEPTTKELVPMVFDRIEWSPFDDKSAKAHAEDFCCAFPKRYSNTVVSSCAGLLEPALRNIGRRMRSQRTRHLIGVRNGMLEILPDGRVELLEREKDLYLPIVVDLEIYPQRCDEETDPVSFKKRRFYKPFSTEELEAMGEKNFFKLLFGLFPEASVRACFQRFFGDILTAIRSQRFAVLEGPGGNGKSQMLQVWNSLITKGVAFNFNKSGQFDLQVLFFAAGVACDEFKKGRADTTLIKQILGRSKIPINRKFLSMVSYIVDAKHLWAWNEAPQFNDDSGAIETRLVRFQTAGNVKRGRAGEVQDMAELVLAIEKGLVFDWALNGAIGVVQDGHVPTDDELPDAMKASRAQALVEADPMLGFVREFEITAKPDVGNLYAKDDVYELMLEYFEKEGRSGSAKMSKDTALKALKRVLEKECGDGCMGSKDLKPEALHNGKKKRWPSVRLRFGSHEPIKPVHRSTSVSAEPELDSSGTDCSIPF
jgi:hypothetical protein